ncbi:saccharopine dehydrogenase NADP-binding domain-containing protein [candidate division KSB1 bacterium]|nr:saccharopine dehydrogenase NADP-binding domain-containing protein [candidate division KSB1 bacterium]
MGQTILILGGYGNTGRLLARLLLLETDVNLYIAGRNREKALTTAEQLNKEYHTNRVRGIYADASKVNTLKKAFEKVDFVLIT